MTRPRILFFSLFLCFTSATIGQTTWTGPKLTFQKQGIDDPLVEANQDRITDLVWLTRGSDNVLFNAKTQTEVTLESQGYGSPEDTEWAAGTTANISTLTFTDFKSAAPKNNFGTPQVKQMAGNDYVLHLITDDVYIDIKILTWQTRIQGAGFSYERSTNQNLSKEDLATQKISIFPNPASEYIRVYGLTQDTHYTIYTLLGSKKRTGKVAHGTKIMLQDLNTGVYLFSLDTGASFRFLKN
jgi:hypothetical protein